MAAGSYGRVSGVQDDAPDHTPDTIQEAVAALHPLVVPIEITLWRGEERMNSRVVSAPYLRIISSGSTTLCLDLDIFSMRPTVTARPHSTHLPSRTWVGNSHSCCGHHRVSIQTMPCVSSRVRVHHTSSAPDRSTLWSRIAHTRGAARHARCRRCRDLRHPVVHGMPRQAGVVRMG